MGVGKEGRGRPPPHARIQVFFLGDRKPPLRLSAFFFCLLICPGPCNNLDPLLKFLYDPPPLLNVRTPPPLLNPGSAPAPPPLESGEVLPPPLLWRHTLTSNLAPPHFKIASFAYVYVYSVIFTRDRYILAAPREYHGMYIHIGEHI